MFGQMKTAASKAWQIGKALVTKGQALACAFCAVATMIWQVLLGGNLRLALTLACVFIAYGAMAASATGNTDLDTVYTIADNVKGLVIAFVVSLGGFFLGWRLLKRVTSR